MISSQQNRFVHKGYKEVVCNFLGIAQLLGCTLGHTHIEIHCLRVLLQRSWDNVSMWRECNPLLRRPLEWLWCCVLKNGCVSKETFQTSKLRKVHRFFFGKPWETIRKPDLQGFKHFVGRGLIANC